MYLYLLLNSLKSNGWAACGKSRPVHAFFAAKFMFTKKVKKK